MTHRTLWSRPLARGYTLVELMVVVAIIGILAAISTPLMMRTSRRASAREAASAVAGILRAARSQAMSRGEAVLVTINLNGPNVVELRRYDLDPTAAGVQPARSCLQAQDVTQYTGNVPAATLPLSELDPNMRLIVAGAQGGTPVLPGTPLNLCFSPDGSIRTAAGSPVGTNVSGCSLGAFVVVSRQDFGTIDNTLSGVAPPLLCANAATSGKRTIAQRNLSIDRESNDLFVIEATYNGAIIVHQ